MQAGSFDKIADKVRWGYLAAFVLLLIAYILTFYSSQEVIKQQQRINHTNNVINTLDDLFAEIRDCESSFRGYLVIKDEKFLGDYYKAPQLSASILINLNSLMQDNTLQRNRLDTLQNLINKKIDLLSAGLIIFIKNNYTVTDSMKSMAFKGKQLMDSIKIFVKKMQTSEGDILTKRSDRLTNFSNLIKVINIASIVIALVLVFYSLTIFNKENNARELADKQAYEFREQLEARVKELGEANNELLELKTMEKFAATGRISRTIAHEVRNPLTNINLATEHLRSEIKSSPDIDILFSMIARNSSRINELINDLLNATKASQLTFEKVQINEIMDQSLEFAQDRIDLKRIKIIKEYATDLCHILADVEKIKIALLNIIVNAIEAMEVGGVLHIKTEHKNNRCSVTISDTGKGMNKESLSRLFEPYFTTKEKGTGLGLTNVQNIILSHHANIHAESEEGKGSAFIILFNYA